MRDRRFLAGRTAATAVEFAIILPAFLALVVFIVESSIQLLTGTLLQIGLHEAARFGITGLPYPAALSADPPASREAAIAEVISMNGFNLINPANLSVTLTSYASFSTVGAAGQGTPGAGGSGAIVQYQVSYFQPWLFPGASYPAAAATGLAGLMHTAVTVVQNEAF